MIISKALWIIKDYCYSDVSLLSMISTAEKVIKENCLTWLNQFLLQTGIDSKRKSEKIESMYSF